MTDQPACECGGRYEPVARCTECDPGSGHTCPDCGNPTTAQPFSGGREWWCEHCQRDGRYPSELDRPVDFAAIRRWLVAESADIEALLDGSPPYGPSDQNTHLGEPPYNPEDPAVQAWEQAHGHDVRLKCIPEFGCLAIAASAERRAETAEALLQRAWDLIENNETAVRSEDTWRQWAVAVETHMRTLLGLDPGDGPRRAATAESEDDVRKAAIDAVWPVLRDDPGDSWTWSEVAVRVVEPMIQAVMARCTPPAGTEPVPASAADRDAVTVETPEQWARLFAAEPWHRQVIIAGNAMDAADRAEPAEGTLAALDAMHRDDGDGYCYEDGDGWPCGTHRVMRGHPPDPPGPASRVVVYRSDLEAAENRAAHAEAELDTLHKRVHMLEGQYEELRQERNEVRSEKVAVEGKLAEVRERCMDIMCAPCDEHPPPLVEFARDLFTHAAPAECPYCTPEAAAQCPCWGQQREIAIETGGDDG